MTNRRTVLRLSGAIEGDEVAELERLMKLEENGSRPVLDLENVTRVDHEGVRLLARSAETGAILENCPRYVQEWIAREREPHGS